eukprot:2880941-Rhodomonas_salina.2
MALISPGTRGACDLGEEGGESEARGRLLLAKSRAIRARSVPDITTGHGKARARPIPGIA